MLFNHSPAEHPLAAGRSSIDPNSFVRPTPTKYSDSEYE